MAPSAAAHILMYAWCCLALMPCRLGPAALSKTAEGWQIDDQLGFSNMIDEGSLPWTSADLPANHSSNSNSSDNATSARWSGMLWGWNKRVKVVPLPPLVVANGHVAFEQRLPELLGVPPVAVHDTFQVYGAEAGKLSRMQENNLWLLHPQEHFAANFLTYENLVTEYVARVARVWQQHTGKPMALLHQHLLAAAFQLQVRCDFQTSFVAARTSSLLIFQAIAGTQAPHKLLVKCMHALSLLL